MVNYLFVALGGAIGSVTRFALYNQAVRFWGENFPWGTIIVNVTGCFIIGFFFVAAGPEGHWMASPTIQNFVMPGICGGFTTFSSFSLQTLILARNSEWLKAGANVMLSVALCLIAVWLGHLLATHLNSAKGT